MAWLKRVVEGTTGVQALLVQYALLVLIGSQLAGKLGAQAALGWFSVALLQVAVSYMLWLPNS